MHLEIDFDTIPTSYKLFNDKNNLIKTGEIDDEIQLMFEIIDNSDDTVFNKIKNKKLLLKAYKLMEPKKITIKEKDGE